MKIFYLNGPNSGIPEDLFPPTVYIGRESDNDIQVLQANVSRYHARLDYFNGKWTFLDLCSTNGSTINGQKVTHATVLKEGDIFSVGDQHFCFGLQSPSCKDENTDVLYGMPPAQTVHCSNPAELQKILAEERSLPKWISYRLTALGILLLVLLLLVGTILAIRFSVLYHHNRELTEQAALQTEQHDSMLFLYEIQSADQGEEYHFKIAFDKDFVELTLNDSENNRSFSSREARPEKIILERLQKNLQQISPVDHLSSGMTQNPETDSLTVLIEFQDFIYRYSGSSHDIPADLQRNVLQLQKLILDFVKQEYDLDPDPDHIPRIMTDVEQDLQYADQLLHKQTPGSVVPEDILEAVLIYRRSLRTMLQFQDVPDLWQRIRKNLAVADQQLLQLIQSTRQQIEYAAAKSPGQPELQHRLETLTYNGVPWKWKRQELSAQTMKKTESADDRTL